MSSSRTDTAKIARENKKDGITTDWIKGMEFSERLMQQVYADHKQELLDKNEVIMAWQETARKLQDKVTEKEEMEGEALSEIDQLKKQNAALRKALTACQELLHIAEPTHGEAENWNNAKEMVEEKEDDIVLWGNGDDE